MSEHLHHATNNFRGEKELLYSNGSNGLTIKIGLTEGSIWLQEAMELINCGLSVMKRKISI